MGWTVRVSNPGGGEIFRTCPDSPWGPPSLLYNGYRVFPGGKERPGRDPDSSLPSSAVGHERVELYLYSPYGPYSLYRASVPVQGCTLLFYADLLPVYHTGSLSCNIVLTCDDDQRLMVLFSWLEYCGEVILDFLTYHLPLHIG